MRVDKSNYKIHEHLHAWMRTYIYIHACSTNTHLNALHDLAVHETSLHTSHYITLQYNAVLQITCRYLHTYINTYIHTRIHTCTTYIRACALAIHISHYVTLHYTTLHYIVLHHMTMHSYTAYFFTYLLFYVHAYILQIHAHMRT